MVYTIYGGIMVPAKKGKEKKMRRIVRKTGRLAAALLAGVFAAGALTGCFSGGNTGNNNKTSEIRVVNLPDNPGEKPENDVAELSSEEWTKPENENKPQTGNESVPGVQASMVDFQTVLNAEEAKQKAVITGYDVAGNRLWEYETKEDYITELDSLSEIITTDSEYIFVAFGDVIALDLATGKELWVNSDFSGASPFWTMNYEGTLLYITGYYGPALFVMDFDGNTINRINCEDDEYFWPSEVTFVSDDQVDVYFDSNEKTKSFDPNGPQKQ